MDIYENEQRSKLTTIDKIYEKIYAKSYFVGIVLKNFELAC